MSLSLLIFFLFLPSSFLLIAPSPIVPAHLPVQLDGVRRIDYVLAYECESEEEEREKNDVVRDKFETHLKKQGLEIERTKAEDSRCVRVRSFSIDFREIFSIFFLIPTAS